MPHALSSFYVRSILDILSTVGFSGMCNSGNSEINPTDLDDTKLRVPVSVLTKVFDRAAEELSEPNIGLKTGYKFRVHTFNETGSVLAYVENIAQAVEVNRQYERLTETVGQCRLDRRTDGDFMLFETEGLDEDLHRHVINLIVTGYAVTTHWLGWSFEGGLSRAGFRHAAPDNAEDFDAIFQCSVEFGCDENFIQFSDGLIDRTLPSHNAEKLAQIRLRLDDVINRVDKTSRFKDALRVEILNAISLGRFNEDDVSRGLNMTPQAFASALRNEKLTLRGQVDEARKELCLSQMRDKIPLTQIAQNLGYSDQSAFTKAFKRWYKVTPSKFSKPRIKF